MDETAADNPPRSQQLAELSDALGMPVLAVVSGWHGNALANLGEEGGRAFIDVLADELDAQDAAADTIGLFLVGRGGFPVFAEAVWRALTARGIDFTAIIPYRIDGVHSLLALSANKRLMHPYGALGAYDRPPLGRFNVRLDAELLGGLEGLAELGVADPELAAELAFERRQARLAHGLMGRMLGGTESGLGARVERSLGVETLGSELALGPDELDGLGLNTEVADAEVAHAIWRLYEAYEDELGILTPPMPRFSESEVADEVEFEPAMGVTGAVIEGVHAQLIYEIDTGSPDPDTNMLDGEWIWEPLVLADL